MADTRRLLILSCSQRKRPDPGLLPAIERYDGPAFRVLRKAKRDGYWPHKLDVLILSAKYGLIELDTPIENYDLRMTREQALTLQAVVSAKLDGYLTRSNYCEVFINLGQIYLIAITKSIISQLSEVQYAVGGIGKKASQMKMWLMSCT